MKIFDVIKLKQEIKGLKKIIDDMPTQEEYINRINELELEIRKLKLEIKDLKKSKK